MINWKLLEEDEAKPLWDRNLLNFPDYTLFQTFMWGEYKRTSGWVPKRWVAVNEKKEIAVMVQGLLRTLPFNTGLIWVPGGPVGDISAIGKGFFDFIKDFIGLKMFFCRFYLNKEKNLPDMRMLEGLGMSKARHCINSGMTMTLDIDDDANKVIERSTKNWRHNFRRSLKYNLSVKQWHHPSFDEMHSLYAEMETSKKIEQQYSKRELMKMFEYFGDRIVLYRCDTVDGELLGFRGCAIVGTKGTDLFAATSGKGRRMYASYALFAALIGHCVDRAVKRYDMGGIDPLNSTGVYNFKKGTGALPVEYMGEWDWASAEWLRWLGNRAIRMKLRRR